MNTDLFGNAYVDPTHCRQIPLFHQPNPAVPVVLPGTTGTDQRIERKFQDATSEPMFEKAKTFSGYRGSAMCVLESSLKERGIPYVSVDEVKRALFQTSKLSAFHFVVYSKTGDNWLVMCREPGHENRTTMEEWQNIFGDGFKSVFAVKRAKGVEYRTLGNEKLALEDLI